MTLKIKLSSMHFYFTKIKKMITSNKTTKVNFPLETVFLVRSGKSKHKITETKWSVH